MIEWKLALVKNLECDFHPDACEKSQVILAMFSVSLIFSYFNIDKITYE